MGAPTDEELQALGVAPESLFDEMRPKTVERFRPFGPKLADEWEPVDEGGRAELGLEGRDETLTLSWRLRRSPLSSAGPGHLGGLALGGHPLQITEDYAHVSTTNGGTFLREGEHRGEQACVTELVRMLDAGEVVLAHEGGDRYCVSCSFRDDVVWHDVDWHRAYVKLTVDVGARAAVLRRIRLDDSSQ